MTCPLCGDSTKVVDTRPVQSSTWRRRECVFCGYRFNTMEVELGERTGLKTLHTEKSQKSKN